MEVPANALPKGTAVKFTDVWLQQVSPAEARRYMGREGQIAGYRAQEGSGTPEPIVDFDKFGRYKPERLFEVPWARLALAEPKEAKD